VHFVGCLYIIDLIDARKMEQFKMTIIIVGVFSIFAQLARKYVSYFSCRSARQNGANAVSVFLPNVPVTVFLFSVFSLPNHLLPCLLAISSNAVVQSITPHQIMQA
jgi:hypothetical protein